MIVVIKVELPFNSMTLCTKVLSFSVTSIFTISFDVQSGLKEESNHGILQI